MPNGMSKIQNFAQSLLALIARHYTCFYLYAACNERQHFIALYTINTY